MLTDSANELVKRFGRDEAGKANIEGRAGLAHVLGVARPRDDCVTNAIPAPISQRMLARNAPAIRCWAERTNSATASRDTRRAIAG